MPVSGYFNNFPSQDRMNNEYRLMEDVIAESIQIMGHNIYYIPRESFDAGDMIFGEYSKSKFDKAYLIEAYIGNISGFEGDNDFFSKFGLEIRETSNMIISRRAFKKIIPSTLRERPQEGDLLYIPVLKNLIEIKFIEHELMSHSLGNKLPYVYEMRCEAFRYSEEEIHTGVDEIDEIAAEVQYTTKIQLNTSPINIIQTSYFDGETVYQSNDGTWANNYASATVKEWYKANGTMFLYNIEGQFKANANVYGNSSQAIYRSTAYDDRTDFNAYDEYDNQELKLESDVFLDLSETNPFGTP
ncbi:hypothetical protein EB001_18865 [bacterium]|nr:hypothetical protein [bacterium]